MKNYRLILRILGSLAFIVYVLFLFGEKVSLINDVTFADVTVYLLFAAFIIGYILLWLNEFISGIIFIIWYIMQWCFVLWIWVDGDITLILGFPIAVIGILLLNYAVKQKNRSLQSPESNNR